MKYLTLVILLLFIFVGGCKRPESPPKKKQTVVDRSTQCVTVEDKKRLSSFILECIKNGNPMSDEEPEDLVEQCEYTGKDVVCPTRCVKKIYVPDYGWTEHDCD